MTRGLRQLVTVGLTVILCGGILSPSVISADAATAEPTTTTKTAEQTYTISSVELPYTKLIQNQQVTKSYWLKKDLSADPAGGANALTVGQLNDDAYMADFAKYNDNDEIAQSMSYLFQTYFGEKLTAAADTTVGAYFYSLAPDEYDSLADSLYAAEFGAYSDAWWISNLTQYQIDQSNYAHMQQTYKEKIRPGLIATGQDSLLTQYDPAFEDEAKFVSLEKYLYGMVLPALIQKVHVADYTLEQRTQLNPDTSAAETKAALAQPLSTYLTKQADGTYQLSGMIIYPGLSVFSFDDKVLPPIVDPNPGPDPTPTPATSQPVTVHYVDTAGNALADPQTLTGDLGTTYESSARKITNYALKTTLANATGKFTSTAQTVTYVYQKVLTSGAGADITAPKGSVVYATNKIGLYKSAAFTKQSRKQWYAKKSRQNRPMFVVTGYAKSKNGVKHYRVKDVNHHSKTAGKTGYITANGRYTSRVYYAKKQAKITVISPQGINAYGNKNLTKKTTHYRQGQVLKVKKIVSHKLTTRFVLSNGRYVTANKKLVQAGKVTMPKRVTAKQALNRYSNVNLTKRNRHYAFKSHPTFTVLGWDYSNANNFSKRDTLRYRVAGGYITGNPQLVRNVK